MTTIVAAKKNHKISLGSDALTLFGSRKEISSQKIIQHNSLYLGFSGSAAWNVILRNYLVHTDFYFDSLEELYEKTLVLHKVLKEKYYLIPQDNTSSPVESSEFMLLMIDKSGIYEVDWSRNIRQYSKIAAIGSGEDYALGAMQAIYNLTTNAEEIVLAGLHAAATFDRKTEGPFKIFTIDNRE